MIERGAVIDPRAEVKDASIGAGTRIYQFSTVVMGTIIGRDCTIGACVTLTGPVIGNRCKVSSGVVMGPGFLIGDDVFIGPNVVLANDLWPATDTGGYDDDMLRARSAFCVVVEDGAAIGANAVILPGVRIGAGAVVAACSRVTRDVPPNGVWNAENGYIAQKPADWRQRRMRYARPSR